MNRLKIAKAVAVGLFAMLGMSAAHAGLIGKNVTFQLLYPGPTGDVYGTGSATVVNGTVIGPIYNGGEGIATFSDASIRFDEGDCCQWVPNVYYKISGTDLGITNVTLDALASNQAPAFWFDKNDILINVSGQIIAPGQYFTLDVTTTSDVPEPASLALAAAGLAGLGLARRKRA